MWKKLNGSEYFPDALYIRCPWHSQKWTGGMILKLSRQIGDTEK